MSPLDGYGVGIGWRPEIAGVVADIPDLRFTEVIAESVLGRSAIALEELRARGVRVIPHGTRLSLGSAEPLDPRRVRQIAEAANILDSPLASEHIAFVRAGGLEAGHLLPLPRSRDALDVLVRNVAVVRAELDAPLALEPIAALFDWPDDEFSEADFLTELLERTDSWLLLDVANVYANARNRGTEPTALLDRIPLERIAYVHVAGGSVDHEGLYHDTHTDPTPAPVLDLLGELTARLPGTRPPLMLERDGRYPPAAELYAELAAIGRAGGRSSTGGATPASIACSTRPAGAAARLPDTRAAVLRG
ncbi:MAG TPA: DUF692 domain-containing protein [Pseudonocardia sp.]|jgi:hypothetical protein|nr:DUF692 domain-containing protein [Pseudonocardia sp.]